MSYRGRSNSSIRFSKAAFGFSKSILNNFWYCSSVAGVISGLEI
ncbi:hypothetical protein CP8484711_1191A, partial [Chlamydia psittaci 84-8471/1]